MRNTKRRILIVDDEPDTLRLVRDLLVQAHYSVTAASSSVEALMHIHLTKFDLILLDLMMPGIDGHQLAEHLSSHWDTFEIPVIVVSCRKDAESKFWAKEYGCVRYLEKPFSPAELLETVGEYTHGRT